MKHYPSSNHKQIDSDFCGRLTEVLNVPEQEISIAVLVDVSHTKAHYHQLSLEYYWLEEGELTVRVEDDEVTMKAGDILAIMPGEAHEIVKASKKNRLIAISSPRYTPEDEYEA
ncbi:MAG: Cupin domain protein [candidate division WS6 bacterium OLB20]|uniref:Cupin domain protein n=1 Tax=candidate division WS6 bacterium OLB20 TaxID=1617426 RepID=A0A136LYF8_9BACT|nr:MAG: Cupin domain protein [candidate division WS6 bacterium OLB20]